MINNMDTYTRLLVDEAFVLDYLFEELSEKKMIEIDEIVDADLDLCVMINSVTDIINKNNLSRIDFENYLEKYDETVFTISSKDN